MWKYSAVGFCLLFLFQYNDSSPCNCDYEKNQEEESVYFRKRDVEEDVSNEITSRLGFIKAIINSHPTTMNSPNSAKSDLKNKPHFSRNYEKGCSKYIEDRYFDLKMMADVWKILYYQLPERLTCFKLLFVLLTEEDKYTYSLRYGNFNNSVDWSKCVLEVTSDYRVPSSRRHFLQHGEAGGVMENIIIDEARYQNYTIVVLSREPADQWFVLKNIMVMRDCDSGLIAVFSRVPYEPKRKDIRDVLSAFGDEEANGGVACDSPMTSASWLKN